ncbi:Crp/Fnr family transcriptional regulator [Paracoccus suum]|nr:Crp/Fnr family transcriptional regulator [Paracoccus suum]
MPLASSDMTLDRAYPDLFNVEEARLMRELMEPPESNRPRTRVIRAGVELDVSLYLCDGFMGRFSCDRLGRRQFVALQVPGDYVDLPAYLLKKLDYDVDSLGLSISRLTRHDRLQMVGHEFPDLYRKLWRITMIDSAIHRYWIFRVGRLAGKARLANFFCEMFLRLFARGLAQPEGFALPTSQADLAEICGVTPVHVNRLLAELRLDGICTFTNARLDILDLPRLFRVGEHSRGYLFLSDEVEETVRPLIGDNGRRFNT